MAYTNAVAHNLAAIRAARRAAAPIRAAKQAAVPTQKREPDAADCVAERVYNAPTPRRQQEDW